MFSLQKGKQNFEEILKEVTEHLAFLHYEIYLKAILSQNTY